MNNLKFITFLVPVIALLLVVLLFVMLLKQTSNKAVFKRAVLSMSGLAFLLNFAWEVIQIPLYKGGSFNLEHILFCGLSAIADAIMVLLIYISLALIFKNPLWIRSVTLSRILILMLIGGIGAIGAEIRNVASGTWAYATAMPIIPFLNVGLVPVLQFMLLPGCIYYLIFKVKKYE